MIVGYLIIFGPLMAFLVAGYFAADRADTKWPALGLVAVGGTLAWLAYVGLVAHADGTSTVFGTDPVLHGDSAFFIWPLVSLIPCALAGWRKIAKPIAIGAATVVGPAALAYPTMPRGDGDGLWGLVFLYLPFFGLGFTLVATIATALRRAWRPA